MNILVTGGAGFIGSHIVDALIELNYTVHIVDDMSGGFHRNVHPNATLHEVDIRSSEIETLWAEHKFEVLYHCAAQMDVRKSVADPKFDADVNIMGLLNLLESGRKNGLRKVIFSSTGGAIYGEPETIPQGEDHVNRPLSPYGITKLVSEKYLFFYEKTHGLEWVALRYGNVYGPRQNAHGEAGVIAIFTERMLRNQQAFVNGPGEQTRDYVYVGDVVQANIKALDYDKNDIFNVGTSVETSVNTLFRTLQRLTETTIEEVHQPAKAGEQERSVIGTAKIEREMGWILTHNLDQGLTKTVEFFKEKKATEEA